MQHCGRRNAFALGSLKVFYQIFSVFMRGDFPIILPEHYGVVWISKMYVFWFNIPSNVVGAES
jgi:hypothetical protein